MSRLRTATLCAVLVLAAACSGADEKVPATSSTTPATTAPTTTAVTAVASLAELAVAYPQLSTFVTLADASDLAGVSASEGPVTVLAPTNDAFSALPAEAAEQLKSDPAALASALSLHVLRGTLLPEDLAALDGSCADTLGGGVPVTLSKDGAIKVGGAEVLGGPLTAGPALVYPVAAVLTAPGPAC